MTDNTIEILLSPDDLHEALHADARTGLSAQEKWLPPKYFYDERGSALFEAITELAEYYPTRTEHAILSDYADQMAKAAGADSLVELGSGSSTKTRLLLDALTRTDRLAAYVPVDVSVAALEDAAAALRSDYPSLQITPVVADFDQHLSQLPGTGLRLFALLGSTIGNYPPVERQTFLSKLASAMHSGESLLLGVDLVKEPARLVAAYNDSAGVTAAFNLNVINVLNRELDGDLPGEAFTHRALWDPVNEWIEMRLQARRPISAHLRAIDLLVNFEEGEEVRTEISAKFTRTRIEGDLRASGLALEEWWSDPADDFAVLLARK